MYCHNCGAKIPDGSKFCSECGVAIAPPDHQYQSQTGTLCVMRQSALGSSAVNTKIYVDGELKTTLKNGDSKSFLLDVGTHDIEMYTPMNGRRVQQVTIKPDTETVLHFKLSSFEQGSHGIVGLYDSSTSAAQPTRSEPIVVQVNSQPSNNLRQGKVCPRCGGVMSVQTVSESRKAGCGTVLLYILLFITILGWLILIPLLLRKKTETVTYAVCQSCGYQKVISRR